MRSWFEGDELPSSDDWPIGGWALVKGQWYTNRALGLGWQPSEPDPWYEREHGEPEDVDWDDEPEEAQVAWFVETQEDGPGDEIDWDE